MLRLLLACLVVLVSGCSAGDSLTRVVDRISGSTNTSTIVGSDDPLEPNVEVNTLDYQRQIRKGSGHSDAAFRAYVSKSGRPAVSPDTSTADVDGVVYQMYVVTQENGWVGWDQARYLVGDDLRETTVKLIGAREDCDDDGDCLYKEFVVATVPRADLEALSMQQDPETPIVLRLVSSQTGFQRDVTLDPAEMFSLLDTVDLVKDELAAK